MKEISKKQYSGRLEVMNYLESYVDEIIDKLLKPIDTNWQPADLLPDSRNPDFF